MRGVALPAMSANLSLHMKSRRLTNPAKYSAGWSKDLLQGLDDIEGLFNVFLCTQLAVEDQCHLALLVKDKGLQCHRKFLNTTRRAACTKRHNKIGTNCGSNQQVKA